MNSTRRITLGAAAVLASTGLLLTGASGAQADDRGNGPLSSLVSSGTLTSAQATAVKSALTAAHEEGRAEHQAEKQGARDAALASLVAQGTLTQAQADAIAAADRGEMRDLVRSGTVTREQLRAVHDALKADRTESREDHRAERAADTAAVLADLVAKGTLTQAQADAVASALAERPGHGGRGHGSRGDRR